MRNTTTKDLDLDRTDSQDRCSLLSQSDITMATMAIMDLMVEGVEDEVMDPVTDIEVPLLLIMSTDTDMEDMDMGIDIMDLLLLLLDMDTQALLHLDHLDHMDHTVMALALTNLDHPVIDFPLLHLPVDTDMDMDISIGALPHLDHLGHLVMDPHLDILLLHRIMGETIEDLLLQDQCTQVVRSDEVQMAMDAVSSEITSSVQTLGMVTDMDITDEGKRPLVMLIIMAMSDDTKVRLIITDTALKG